jgi:hypothetical protein
VLRLVATWPDSQLNWAAAVRKCRMIPRSCFIGVRTADAVPILALIRVSDARLHTNLLFLEKDADAVAPGLAMTLIDAVLQVLAGAFRSERIVLDNPLSDLVSYYEAFGYEPMNGGAERRPRCSSWPKSGRIDGGRSENGHFQDTQDREPAAP